MGENQYNNVSPINKVTLGMFCFDFVALWYYFMGGSISLRPMASLVWVMLAIVGFFIFRMRYVVTDNYMKFIFLMIMVILASSIYSIDRSATMKYSLSIVLYFIIAYQITSNYENVKLVCRMMMVFLVFLLFVTYVQKFSPDAYLSVFSGFLPQAYHSDVLLFIQNGSCNGFYNQTSSNAISLSLGVGLSVYFFKKHINENSNLRYLDLVLILAFFYGVVLTSRRGSTIICAVLLAVLLYTTKGKFGIKVGILLAGIGLIVSGEYRNIQYLSNIIRKFDALSLARDISDGRFAIWRGAFELIGERPLLGYGMDSMASGVLHIGNAHNSYLQSLLEVGIIGTFFYFLPFMYGAGQVIKKYFLSVSEASEVNAFLYFCFFWQIYCFLNGLFEAFFSSEIAVFILFIIQFIGIRIISNKNRR